MNPTTIIFVHGDKGGVGKSTSAQSIADYLMFKEQPIAVVDSDISNPDVARMFDAYADCQKINLRTENGWMDLMDFTKAHLGSNIIVNLPAGIGDEMQKNIEIFSMFLGEQRKEANPITQQLWWVMNLSHDAVNLFDQAYTSYGKYFDQTRVICNLHASNGQKEPFYLWHESDLKKKLEINNRAMTIYLPPLHLRVVQKLFMPSKVMPFSAALEASAAADLGLYPSEAMKLKFWHLELQNALALPFGFEVPEEAKVA